MKLGTAFTSRLVRLLLPLFGHLPWRVNQTIGGSAGMLLWWLSPKLRRLTLANLKTCFPDADARWLRRTGRRSLIESARAMTEAPWLWRQSKSTLRSMLRYGDNAQLLQIVGSRGEAIIATPHLGSWEFAGLCLAILRPTTALYRPPRMASLDAMIRRSRTHTGSRLVPTTAAGVRALYQALEHGEVVGLLPDQTPKGNGGVFAPFFGQPAYTMRLLSNLARPRRTPVVLAFCERLQGERAYRVHAVRAGDAIYSEDPAKAAAELNRCVETLIRRSPEQYLWSYRRFSRRPPE